MKVKIIQNAPDNSVAQSIEKFVGGIYPAKPLYGTNNISVDFGIGYGEMTVYPDEYELLDTRKELIDYINGNKRECSFCREEVVDFLLQHKNNLFKILM